MRSLLNYIIEKLDINKVNLIDLDAFPYDGSVEDIKKFLIHCDFIKTKNAEDYPILLLQSTKNGDGSANRRIRIFDNAHGLCYAIPDTVAGEAVSFANTSKKKISEDNPMINIYKPYGRNIIYELRWTGNIKNIDIITFVEKIKEILKQ